MPNPPVPRPDVAGIEARAKGNYNITDLRLIDIPALIAYIGRLEMAVKAARGFELPDRIGVVRRRERLRQALAALGDGDG